MWIRSYHGGCSAFSQTRSLFTRCTGYVIDLTIREERRIERCAVSNLRRTVKGFKPWLGGQALDETKKYCDSGTENARKNAMRISSESKGRTPGAAHAALTAAWVVAGATRASAWLGCNTR